MSDVPGCHTEQAQDSESRGQPGMPGPQQHRSSRDPLGSQAWQSWSFLPIDTHESPQAAWYALPGTCRSSGTTVHSPIMTCGHPDPVSGKMQRAEGGPFWHNGMLPTFTLGLLPTSWDPEWWVFKSQQSILEQPKALAGEFYCLSSGYKNRGIG